ncbi:MAG: 50S ribosomal protein L17 [Phascolarctobacterium sp.]|nr:50S ribosomal protein L17 [Candidatus Phascolarctobacterium caballi]MCQ2381261.1 50S ribosomal protein L17 [Acidaminococcaceae bacterium]
MFYRKLNRNSGNRRALFRSLLVSFFRYGRIETTITKAKEVAAKGADLITLAQKATLAARRQAIAELQDEEVVKKLFDDVAPKYKERKGGFTRIYRKGPRRGDAAEMAIIELI